MFKRLKQNVEFLCFLIMLMIVIVIWIVTLAADSNKSKKVSTVCDKACQIDRQYKKIAQQSIILEKYKTTSRNAGTEFMRNYSWYKATQRKIKQLQQSVNLYISKDSTPQGLEVMRDKILGLSEEGELLKPQLDWQTKLKNTIKNEE